MKTRTNITIDEDLMRKIADLKAAGIQINVSKICQDGLRAAVEKPWNRISLFVSMKVGAERLYWSHRMVGFLRMQAHRSPSDTGAA